MKRKEGFLEILQKHIVNSLDVSIPTALDLSTLYFLNVFFVLFVLFYHIVHIIFNKFIKDV